MLNQKSINDAIEFCTSKISHFYSLEHLHDYAWSDKTEVLGGYDYVLIREDDEITAFVSELLKKESEGFIVMKRHLDLIFSNKQIDYALAEHFSEVALNAFAKKDETSLKDYGYNFPDFHGFETQTFLKAYIGYYGSTALLNAFKISRQGLFLTEDELRKFAWSYICKKNLDILTKISNYIRYKHKLNIVEIEPEKGWVNTSTEVDFDTKVNPWFDVYSVKRYVDSLREVYNIPPVTA